VKTLFCQSYISRREAPGDLKLGNPHEAIGLICSRKYESPEATRPGVIKGQKGTKNTVFYEHKFFAF